MKYRLPKLTAIWLLLTVRLAGPACGQSPPEPPAAQLLVQQAVDNIARQESVEAKLRQKVELFGTFLVGNGSYRQLSPSPSLQMFRLEMRLQAGDRLTSLLEVNDGSTLWIRHDFGDRQSLSYVNLSRIQQTAQSSAQDGAEGQGGASRSVLSDVSRTDLALGGLHQLLAGLNASFDFGPPVAMQLGAQPVWQLTGQWKPSVWAQMLPGQPAGNGASQLDLSNLPRHLPTTVVLTLGRDDELPLFPYRIEYLRQRENRQVTFGQAGSGKPAYRLIASMELFEVRRYQIQRSDFTFQLGDEPVVDRTNEYLLRLGLQTDPAE